MLNIQASQIIIQIIAFLIMLWVMKKFGWQPLLDILKERREKIQAEFDNIDAQKAEVAELNRDYEEKMRGIDAEARRKIQEGIEEGQRISSEIQSNAQENARDILQKAHQEMEIEADKAKSKLKKDMVNLVVDVTEKLLHEKLDETGQKKLLEKFISETNLK